MDKNSAKIRVAVMCGGPSLERGISLNSARSAMDHLEAAEIEIVPIYFDGKKNAYKISKVQLYSNNPSDFDFKLQQASTPLTEKSLVSLLKSTDIVFPIMHGTFGEDGEIQSFLEKHHLPFIGSGSEACKKAFDKFIANEFIRENGFFALPSAVLKIYGTDHKEVVEDFFREHNVKRAVVKPASGGSSIGVFSVGTPEEALEKVQLLFSKRMDTRVVVEPFAEGVEFTMIILQNRFGLPVALTPTEIETDYTDHQIFDFRKKYLPTRQVTWHCPPRFDNKMIEKIQAQGEQLFALFGMRDFARFDGWVLPDGNIWFCDFNPVSGMEQNSFLFQQASRIGMTHSDVLRYVAGRGCQRYGIGFPGGGSLTAEGPSTGSGSSRSKKTVPILMGGDNSERQVSLMSGTNVWLKLRKSEQYHPQPYLLDAHGAIWKLPYQLCLNHTVEEITENCENYQMAKERLAEFEDRARLRLGLLEPKDEKEFFEPQQLSMKELMHNVDFIFLALHGGDGEDGTLQKLFEENGVRFNGPDEAVSRLCIDKWETSEVIRGLGIEGASAIPGRLVMTKDVVGLKNDELQGFWNGLKKELGASTVIVKPRADGCTTGIAHLYTAADLQKYAEMIQPATAGSSMPRAAFIPKNSFQGQTDIIEMPTSASPDLLFEKFIETDVLRVKANQLKHTRRSGWVEITVGVVGKKGAVRALNPSITIAEGEVLTVEEKFQGGTGVNITPPPESIMKAKVLKKIKGLIEQVAAKIGIQGYSRIDAFANIDTGDLLIIEVNTLPGLTPATVLYHQGLAENPPIFPHELLEMLIETKL